MKIEETLRMRSTILMGLLFSAEESPLNGLKAADVLAVAVVVLVIPTLASVVVVKAIGLATALSLLLIAVAVVVAAVVVDADLLLAGVDDLVLVLVPDPLVVEEAEEAGPVLGLLEGIVLVPEAPGTAERIEIVEERGTDRDPDPLPERGRGADHLLVLVRNVRPLALPPLSVLVLLLPLPPRGMKARTLVTIARMLPKPKETMTTEMRRKEMMIERIKVRLTGLCDNFTTQI